jgi:DnaK suppressor protein
MEEQDLLQFKEQLEAMKAEINTDVEQTLTEMTSQTGNIPDPNDRASMESDRSFELRIRGPGAQAHGKGRGGPGADRRRNYGICADCGCDIAVKRLQARPVAKFCIDCKTRQEQREKEQGDRSSYA